MKISRENIDELNAIVTIDINKEDYEPRVAKILKDYRKTANIPGFRKGHVPIGIIKKQYGQAVLVDEINKLLQENLNKYLTEEKLDFLGNPLPRERTDFSWDNENYSFDFELGLAPQFEVNLQTKKPITRYKITADKKMIDKQVKHIRTQYGKLKSLSQVENEENLISGVFKNEEKGIDEKSTFTLEKIKGKINKKKLLEAKVGDTLELKSKNLFEKDEILAGHLGLDADEIKDLNIPLSFTITEVNEQELAELNPAFFEKIFGKEVPLKTAEEFEQKIKEDTEKQFEHQSDQQLLNDISDTLIEETQFDLPDGFLEKWIQVSGEKELSTEEAREEYQRSEKGLRFQLIENEIMKAHDIKIEFNDIMTAAKERIRMQMAQFGQLNPSEEELDDIAKRILSNQQEIQNFSNQAKNEKLLQFYKEHLNLQEKEVTFDAFVEEITKK